MASRIRPPAKSALRILPAWALATAALVYWLAAGVLALVAAHFRYDGFSRTAPSAEHTFERDFVLQVARNAAVFGAFETLAAAALLFAGLALVLGWARRRGDAGRPDRLS